MHMLKKHTGFTLVELVIVIIVIAILSTIVVASYRGYQDRAKHERAQQDIQQLVTAIKTARVNNGGKTFMEITGFSWSSDACYAANDGGSNTNNLEPKLLSQSSTCWNIYRFSIDTIAQASGVNITALKKGDPYGNPYYLDENEGEWGGGAPCARDIVSMFRPGTALIYEHMPEKPEWRPSWFGAIPSTNDPYKVEVYVPMIKPGASC